MKYFTILQTPTTHLMGFSGWSSDGLWHIVDKHGFKIHQLFSIGVFEEPAGGEHVTFPVYKFVVWRWIFGFAWTPTG